MVYFTSKTNKFKELLVSGSSQFQHRDGNCTESAKARVDISQKEKWSEARLESGSRGNQDMEKSLMC